ncbi:MAG: hypothetical protein WEB93_07545 [Sphingomonadales bacterium]
MQTTMHIHATLQWLCDRDPAGRRAGVVRVHPDANTRDYVWSCTVADDGRGTLELYGAIAMVGNVFAIRRALHRAAKADPDGRFTQVRWERLRSGGFVTVQFDG